MTTEVGCLALSEDRLLRRLDDADGRPKWKIIRRPEELTDEEAARFRGKAILAYFYKQGYVDGKERSQAIGIGLACAGLLPALMAFAAMLL